MSAHLDSVAALAAAPEAVESPDFVTMTQACRYVKISRRTLYNWIAQGKLTVYRSAGGLIRLDRRELIRKESAPR
jgi:excisionase family DNA binding protein